MVTKSVARIFLLALLALTIASTAIPNANAEWIAPKVYSQTSLGSGPTPEIGFALSIDCNQSAVRIFVLGSENRPLDDATTFLKYVQDVMIILSKNETDEHGYAVHNVPGQFKYMKTGRFVISIEKKGYLTRDVEFGISTCYAPPTPPPQTQSNPTPQNDLSNQQTPKQREPLNQTETPKVPIITQTNASANAPIQAQQNSIELPFTASQAIAIAVAITSLVLAFLGVSKVKNLDSRSEKRWKRYENRRRLPG